MIKTIERSAGLGLMAAAALLCGCATTSVDVSGLPRVQIPIADDRPPEDSRRQVLVTPFNDSSHPDAVAVGAASAAEEAVKHVARDAGAEIVDRSMYKNVDIRRELELCEAQGTPCLQIEAVTDSVLGEVSSVEYGSRFNEAQRYTDKKGNTYNTPASCDYWSNVRGSALLYKMPEMSLRETVYYSGRGLQNVQTNDRSCKLSDDLRKQLAQNAARSAVKTECSALALKNSFSPEGYVIEYRRNSADKKGNYFLISLSPAEGATPGAEAQVLIPYTQIDPATRKKTKSIEPLGTGRVLKDETGQRAWLQIKEPELANQIKAGHLVRVKYKEVGDVEKATSSLFGTVNVLLEQTNKVLDNSDPCSPTS